METIIAIKKKYLRSDKVSTLEDLPNIGSATVADLKKIGIKTPADLMLADPLDLFKRLCLKTKQHHDPCTLDIFISAVRFMNGAPPKPWWAYTNERKKLFLN